MAYSWQTFSMVALWVTIATALPHSGQVLTEENVDTAIQALPVVSVPPVPHHIVLEATLVPPLPQASETQLWTPSQPISQGTGKEDKKISKMVVPGIKKGDVNTDSISKAVVDAAKKPTGAAAEAAQAKAAVAAAPLVRLEDAKRSLIKAQIAAASPTNTKITPVSNLAKGDKPQAPAAPRALKVAPPNDKGTAPTQVAPVSSGVGEITKTGQPSVTPASKEAKGAPPAPHKLAAKTAATSSTDKKAAKSTQAKATAKKQETKEVAQETPAQVAKDAAASITPTAANEAAGAKHMFKTLASKHPNSEEGPKRTSGQQDGGRWNYNALTKEKMSSVGTTPHAAAPSACRLNFVTVGVTALAAVALAAF